MSLLHELKVMISYVLLCPVAVIRMLRHRLSQTVCVMYTTKLEVPGKCLRVRTCSSESDAFAPSYKLFLTRSDSGSKFALIEQRDSRTRLAMCELYDARSGGSKPEETEDHGRSKKRLKIIE